MIVNIIAEDTHKRSIYYGLDFEDADSDHFVLTITEHRRMTGGETVLVSTLSTNRIQIKKKDIKRLAKLI